MRLKLNVLALLAAVAFGTNCSPKKSESGASQTLRFSAIPDQNKTELQEKFGRIAGFLSNELKVPVEYVPASDYKASVDLFKNGDIHLAWFGGLTGVQARHAVDGARAIAQGASDPAFITYFIAHRDTGLSASPNFPMGIAEHQFAFGSQSSTSGRLMPEFHIREKTGKSPEEFFSNKPVFSGSHTKTVELVASGRAKVGAVNFKVYDQMVAEGKVDPAEVSVIWRTPTYADYNFTAHPELEKIYGAGFIDKLQAAILKMDGDLLSAFPRDKMISAKNEEFDGIKAVAEDLGFLK